MEIKKIGTISEGNGVFAGTFGVVETTDGRRFQYGLEFDPDTWKDTADYLDNVKSDFANESTAADFGQDESGIFYEVRRICHRCEYGYFPFGPGECEHPDGPKQISPADEACPLFQWADDFEGKEVTHDED